MPNEILTKLYEGRIVTFALTNDKKAVYVEEGCDNFFSTTLTKEEMEKLIGELQAIHNDMKSV